MHYSSSSYDMYPPPHMTCNLHTSVHSMHYSSTYTKATAGGRAAAKLGAVGWAGIHPPLLCVCVCVCVCIHHTSIHIYIYIHIYVQHGRMWTHTHTHTHIQTQQTQHGRMVDTEKDDLMMREKCKLCRGGGSMVRVCVLCVCVCV